MGRRQKASKGRDCELDAAEGRGQNVKRGLGFRMTVGIQGVFGMHERAAG